MLVMIWENHTQSWLSETHRRPRTFPRLAFQQTTVFQGSCLRGATHLHRTGEPATRPAAAFRLIASTCLECGRSSDGRLCRRRSARTKVVCSREPVNGVLRRSRRDRPGGHLNNEAYPVSGCCRHAALSCVRQVARPGLGADLFFRRRSPPRARSFSAK